MLNIIISNIDKIQLQKILIHKKFINFLIDSLQNNYNKSLFINIKEYIEKNKICKLNIPTITNPTLTYNKINIYNIKIKSSNSKPLIIPCIVTNKHKKKMSYELLYKKDDLRKERIIMNAIILMDKLFKKETNIDLHIIKYNILPISIKEGFIEIIPKDFASTLKRSIFCILRRMEVSK